MFQLMTSAVLGLMPARGTKHENQIAWNMGVSIRGEVHGLGVLAIRGLLTTRGPHWVLCFLEAPLCQHHGPSMTSNMIWHGT